jgi:two-component system response regulator HydG
MEAELFGYEKGAFTGASSSRRGKFEEASGGTVFLDEIGELDISLQAKLLRVLETKEVVHLGSSKSLKVDFRLISSTNRDLDEEVRVGHFRRDLFYRINVISIPTVPLRDRIEDLPLLVAAFVNEFCMREKKTITVRDDVVKLFQSYLWPGNVRQLRNVIERMVVLSRGDVLTRRDVPLDILSQVEQQKAVPQARKTLSDRGTLKELEIQAVKDALAECGGNKSKAARLLGISRKALYRKLEAT